VMEKSGLVAVVNTFDDRLELVKAGARGSERCGAVQVGMRPVAAAVVSESERQAALWVVNHLSDSISVVRVDTRSCQGEVLDTLYTGDEPRDIVVARNRRGEPRVFVAAAHRGQHHPEPGARLGTDLTLPPSAKERPGLGDVFVFDPRAGREPIAVVNLFSDVPRALAGGPGVVYAASFRSGNATTQIPAERAAERGVKSLSALLAKDGEGHFREQNGRLLLSNEKRRARIEGGMPAVRGSGRCMPDPRIERSDRFLQQVCVQTDARQRVLDVFVEQEGAVNPRCQCTSGDGTLQPMTGVIVKFFERPAECGDAYQRLPDGTQGCWLDAAPDGAGTPAAHAGDQAPPMAWNDDVRLGLPDQDVFAIDVDALAVRRAFSGVGTVLFGMAVQPKTGRVFVANTDALNLTRFEGRGQSSSTSVIGHLHESRITLIDPLRGRVEPVHLNTHVDYSRCCERRQGENEQSFAFPTAGAFSEDGREFYFTALGSDKVGVVSSESLSHGFDNTRARRDHALGEIWLSKGGAISAGPVGLALDARRKRLYVKTHISNELVVIEPDSRRVLQRLALHNPEPASIRDGRHVLYDARLTSSHGDSACASCHVFGDFDGVSWDLGDPDGKTVNNPGPFAVPTEFAALAEIARDPFGEQPLNRAQTPDFRSNKGPMSTQTLRGLPNQGAQHWRGDRTRRFADAPGRQPNFGSLDEDNSFGEFDVAIAGLNGNDRQLSADTFQRFTNFALQLTLPPNPVRALDNGLDEAQSEGRALFFGCQSMSDAQFERGECVALDGGLVDVEAASASCDCAHNPIVGALAQLPSIRGFAGVLRSVLGDAEARDAITAAAATAHGLPPEAASELARLLARFDAVAPGLLAANLSLNDAGLLTAPAASALAEVSGTLLAVLELSRTHGTPSGAALLEVLAGFIPVDVLPAEAPLRTPEGFRAGLEGAFGLSNIDLRVLADEAARGSGAFHDLLQGCDPRVSYRCELRVSDSFKTCHGCHTLDPAGNAPFDVYRPGFFGTSGLYSFENESQVFKVPHLRNLYQKAGMFGMPVVPFFLADSLLGARLGGFFAEENAFMGPQVRGGGFFHDGTTDTLQRFHGASVFAVRDPGTLGDGDPGNPKGLEAFLPEDGTRSACIQQFRAAPSEVLGSFDPELAGALALCLSTSAVPDECFDSPASDTCSATLSAIAESSGDATFPALFRSKIRPACFQLGSMLEGGSAEGVCYPEGLRERERLEAFMLAFDSNLKPMVGQQITLHDKAGYATPFTRALFAAAARSECDIALWQNNRGLLLKKPNADDPRRSRVVNASGREFELGSVELERGPVTLTCYPPHADRAEARRAAFGPG
jgi:DNA-binding beta-propeller fold protein YncE